MQLMQRAPHARVRVGKHDIAVPAAAVLAARHADAPLAALPRRGGAAVGACDTPWGVVPVIDLSRWLDMGTTAEPGRVVLVLQHGSRRVAVRADELRGISAASGVERLLHDEDPDELFQSAVRWPAGAGLSALLDVGRLADLAQAWAGLADAAPVVAPAPTAPGVRLTVHAVLSAGGHLWAIPAAQLLQVVSALPLESALAGDSATRGFCTWRGSKMPVVDLARLLGKPGPPGGLMALVAEGDRAAAFQVDAVRQLVPFAPATGGAGPLVRVPGLGEVRPIDVAALLSRLPEASVGHAPHERHKTRASITNRRAAAGVPHVLFEHDATYATPAERVLQVLALDQQQASAVAEGAAVHLPWRGRMVPLHALPCYSGRPAGLPQVALVVDVPDAEGPVAIAAVRLHGWETTARADGVRLPSMGELGLLTVGDGAARSSHMVIDLAEVAYALA